MIDYFKTKILERYPDLDLTDPQDKYRNIPFEDLPLFDSMVFSPFMYKYLFLGMPFFTMLNFWIAYFIGRYYFNISTGYMLLPILISAVSIVVIIKEILKIRQAPDLNIYDLYVRDYSGVIKDELIKKTNDRNIKGSKQKLE